MHLERLKIFRESCVGRAEGARRGNIGAGPTVELTEIARELELGDFVVRCRFYLEFVKVRAACGRLNTRMSEKLARVLGVRNDKCEGLCAAGKELTIRWVPCDLLESPPAGGVPDWIYKEAGTNSLGAKTNSNSSDCPSLNCGGVTNRN